MSQRAKIKILDDLVDLVANLRASGTSVVHCHGTFDPVHLGSIRLLGRAKQAGDVLVVTLSPAPVGRNEDPRPEIISALDVVDFLAVDRGDDVLEVIRRLRPNVYVPDIPEGASEPLAPRRTREQAAVEAQGGKYIPMEVDPAQASVPLSSGHPYPSLEAATFLGSFSATHSTETVLNALQSIRGAQRVLLIGETIIDEYQYCETMGKSGKEPILAVKYVSAEKFAGGVVATANQAADFVDQVGLVSFLGSNDSHEEFIRERLPANLAATFLRLPNSPTTIKRRFVETYPFQKLFEVYVMNDEIDTASSQALHAQLEAVLPSYDLVIVTDYGHGMLTGEIVDLLCAKSKFLAVNSQTNAANQGFNTVSKYPRADYICISEKELRLDARSRTKDLRAIVADVSERLSCPRVLVTRGARGCLCYRQGEGFHHVPAFTQRIVDRIGAGDAVLAVTAVCASRDIPMDIVGFVGNAVGALAVETVGHRGIVSHSALLRLVDSLLQGTPQTEAPCR